MNVYQSVILKHRQFLLDVVTKHWIQTGKFITIAEIHEKTGIHKSTIQSRLAYCYYVLCDRVKTPVVGKSGELLRMRRTRAYRPTEAYLKKLEQQITH